MLCVYYSCIYQDVCIYSPVPFLVEWAWEDLSICYHARTQCSWSLLLWTFFEQESFAVHLYVNSFLTLVLCVFRKQSFVLGRCICVALLHTMLLCHVSCLPFFSYIVLAELCMLGATGGMLDCEIGHYLFIFYFITCQCCLLASYLWNKSICIVHYLMLVWYRVSLKQAVFVESIKLPFQARSKV